MSALVVRPPRGIPAKVEQLGNGPNPNQDVLAGSCDQSVITVASVMKRKELYQFKLFKAAKCWRWVDGYPGTYAVSDNGVVIRKVGDGVWTILTREFHKRDQMFFVRLYDASGKAKQCRLKNLVDYTFAYDHHMWRPVPGCPGYDVSHLGLFRCRMRFEVTAGFQASDYEHLQVSLNGKSFFAHRKVAEAWLPPPDDPLKTVVDHIDRKARNNWADNLRWVTQPENMQNVSPRERKVAGDQSQMIAILRANGVSDRQMAGVFGITERGVSAASRRDARQARSVMRSKARQVESGHLGCH